MSLNKIILSVALTFGLCAPALAEAPEPMMIAQAKGKPVKKRRAKKVTSKIAKRKAASEKAAAKKAVAKKAVAKKAAPAVEMAGEVEVERTAKGAIKSAHLVTEDGEKIQIVLNPKGKSLAKLGGAMKVTGKVNTRKGVKLIRIATFAALPKPEPEAAEVPEADEVPEPVEPPAAVIGDGDGDDNAPMNDDDAPNDDAPSDDAPSDDAPSDDDSDNPGE